MTNKEKKDWLAVKYPLTVIRDRYDGTYSRAMWLAFPLGRDEVPEDVDGEDSECMYFWKNYQEPVGKGAYANDAVKDLIEQMWESEPEESEDERTRRTLVEYFGPQAQLDFIRGVPIQKIRDWLEKQKEPHYIKRNELFDKCVENCDSKVMKEVSDKVDEMLQKEQKHPNGCFTCDEYKKGYEAGRFHGFTAGYNKAMKEQKPAERSEEDEKCLQEMIRHIEHCVTVYGASQHEWQQWLNLLKSLRPQPKQVWTEEDDRICHLIMANLSESARHAITLPMETVDDFNNWLRTLQCMPPVFTDWNEEDQTLLSDALGCVTMVQELKKQGKLKNFHISCSYDELRSWVRSLKSCPRKQPHWKPSEEQMMALINCTIGNEYDVHALVRLFAELKKLYDI